MSSADRVLFCVGLPFSTTRTLSPDEEKDAARWTRHVGVRAWFSLLSAPGVLIAVIVAAALTGNKTVVAFVPITVLFIGVKWAWPHFKRQSLQVALFRQFRKSLRSAGPEVSRFEGPVEALRSWDQLQVALVSEGILQVSPDTSQNIEVLTSAGVVYQVNGISPKRFHLAVAASVAVVPEFAQVAAQWVKPLADNPQTHLHQRALSSAETDELRRLIKSLIPWKGIVMVVAFGALSTAMLVTRGWSASIFIVLFAAVWGRWVIAVAKSLKVIRALGRDSSIGRVVIVRSSELPEDAELGPPSEFLPISRLWWTHAGSVAPWRKGGLLAWKVAGISSEAKTNAR